MTLEMRTCQCNNQMLSAKSEIQALRSEEHGETIKSVVREEQRKMFSSTQLQVAGIADIVREDIQQSLRVPQSPEPQPPAVAYAAASCRHLPPPQPRQGLVTPQLRLPPPHPQDRCRTRSIPPPALLSLRRSRSCMVPMPITRLETTKVCSERTYPTAR